ncbi:MAG: hypothetical protein KF862_22070 [Chitinophagaceae bacterium]|nr:hypothetical protein [Chitinophagaceae bacterium]
MTKCLSCLLTALLCSMLQLCTAQTSSVKGTVTDTANQKKLSNATNYEGVDKTIEKSLKQWGKWGTKYIWQITI